MSWLAQRSFVSPLPAAPCLAWARRALRLAAAVLLAAAFAAAGVGWYASDQLLFTGPPPTLHEQRVLASGPGWIRLSEDEQSRQPGTWALEWRDGFGWTGRVIAVNDAGVVREFRPLVGTPPADGWASVRGVARGADPRTLLGLEFADVSVATPLGACPAWLVPGGDTTWAVLVHGRGANRAEGLRSLGVLARNGLPALLVTYRGDAGAPASPDGYSHLGLTEWRDLEAAARFALAHGARRLVLVGYSMGGQVVMQFLSRSPLAAKVTGVVLESPMLDWNAGLALRARELGAPAFALALGKRVATLRAGLDWGALDQVARTGAIAAPVLLFHDRGDRYAPFERSREFAARHPGNVTFVPDSAGGHVEAWNVDPDRYARTLSAWLAQHHIGRADS